MWNFIVQNNAGADHCNFIHISQLLHARATAEAQRLEREKKAAAEAAAALAAKAAADAAVRAAKAADEAAAEAASNAAALKAAAAASAKISGGEIVIGSLQDGKDDKMTAIALTDDEKSSVSEGGFIEYRQFKQKREELQVL